VVLVDTSIWIDHFRVGRRPLVANLEASEVVMHPLVYGELACGNLTQRPMLLRLLRGLPRVPVVSESELAYLIEEAKLYGRGLGVVDVHLLASCRLAGVRLLTADKRLAAAAKRLKI
jgi:predicted nucleic acid-binding protein